ncbi:MAG: cation transporter [Azoarcus sp.]|nr:cation transporter [Azoarcus sp.]
MLSFNVNGIGCGSCVRKITAAINNIDDEAVVEVDQAAGLVRVHSELEAREIRRAIEDAGYAVAADAGAAQ